MDKMEWALWALKYLRDARASAHDDFNAAQDELRGPHVARRQDWYSTCKNIILTLYHYSQEFVEDTNIPCARFASPDDFDNGLAGYHAFVSQMDVDLQKASVEYQRANNVTGSPYLIGVAHRLVTHVRSAIEYVQDKRPMQVAAQPLAAHPVAAPPIAEDPVAADLSMVIGLARRFHEAVLSLKRHPHGGPTLSINNEWDCQYLFRAVLAAYFADVREEEWNPSVAGSSARCEFFLKAIQTMVELKFVRGSKDIKKVKSELATDLLDYGSNPLVDHVICLVYDPQNALTNPAGLMSDLSGSTRGLATVEVVVSPPRDT